MGKNESAMEYINWYAKQNYDRIVLLVPKGTRDLIKAEASKNGQSMNDFIRGFIPAELITQRERIGRRTEHDEVQNTGV